MKPFTFQQMMPLLEIDVRNRPLDQSLLSTFLIILSIGVFLFYQWYLRFRSKRNQWLSEEYSEDINFIKAKELKE